MGEIAYVALCRECCSGIAEEDLPIPFKTAKARRIWAAAHKRQTGHDQWLVLDQPKLKPGEVLPHPGKYREMTGRID